MSELKKYKLGDLGFFFGGVTTISKEDYGHGTPFLPYKNVYKNSKVNVNELELMNIRPQDIEKRSAKYGDIFFTASSETPDEVAMSSVLLDDVENLTYNGFCKRYRLNDFNTLLPEYARYLFRDINFRREVYQVATGDIRFNISQESLANIEIEIPDVATQAQLAEILMKLDDKIELNLQMNQTLEAMAQLIYENMFATQDKKGWDEIRLGDIIEIRGGFSYKGQYIGSGDALLLGMGCVSFNERFLFSGARPYSGEFSNTYLAKSGDIVIATRQQSDNLPILGFPAKIPKSLEEKEVIVGTNLYKVNNKSDFHNSFLFQLFRSKDYQQQILANSKGSTVRMITKDSVENYHFKIPPKNIFENIETVLQIIDEKIEKNTTHIQTLTQTRDTLLPKLMSGKIEIKN